MKNSFRNAALAAILTLISQGSFAQRMGFTASFGMTSQSMEDLKYIQQYILETYPVEGAITSSFPPFTNVSLNLVREWYDHIHIGGGYSFSTTGGKSSYSDYTGSIATEISATSHRLGAFLSYSILYGDRLNLAIYGRVDANLSTVAIETLVNILGNTNHIINQYRSISPSATAGLELMYKFSGFSLGLDAGYMVDFAGDLRNPESKDYLSDPLNSNKNLTSNWTGWHAGIKTLIWLNY
jgi:hypothetical protein